MQDIERDQPSTETGIAFVCPQCRTKLARETEHYHCSPCQLDFPILFGIADFRLRSDPYLSLEQERAKAKRLSTEAPQDFSSMLDYYYEITDDVPPELAGRYKAYHHNGPKQARHSLKSIALATNDVMLDVGCGTGGALIAAAENCAHLYGMDIALRWLIICQQRLREQGVTATLVCADVENPPFPEHSFSKIVATDLLENVYSPSKTLDAISQLLQMNGRLWIAGSNKFCLGPHPSTRLWAIGYFPATIRSVVVRLFRGVDSLRFIHLISPQFILRFTEQLGLYTLSLKPRMIAIDADNKYPLIDRVLIKMYLTVVRKPFLRQLMVWLGPAFEMILVKSTPSTKQKETKSP